MNREIKFRAWDKDNGNMYHSDRDEDNGEGPIQWYADGQGLYFEENQLIDREMGGEHHQYLEYRKPNQVLMQYTGLKDKNGVEIYEGDIIQADAGSRFAITFESGKFGFRVDAQPGGTFLIEGFWELCDLTDYEPNEKPLVIGNIYENPELLEKEMTDSHDGKTSDGSSVFEKDEATGLDEQCLADRLG